MNKRISINKVFIKAYLFDNKVIEFSFLSTFFQVHSAIEERWFKIMVCLNLNCDELIVFLIAMSTHTCTWYK